MVVQVVAGHWQLCRTAADNTWRGPTKLAKRLQWTQWRKHEKKKKNNNRCTQTCTRSGIQYTTDENKTI